MIKVYGMQVSGNCYKLKLLLSMLGREHDWVEVDTRQGDTHTPSYLAMNPHGKVPLLELDDGRFLPESNAILCYLAEGSDWWPADAFERAQTLRWMFFEQNSLVPSVASARFICRFLPPDHARRSELPALLERGDIALAVMEQHLRERSFFVGERFGIADIALYAYAHSAAEGGFDLARYPAIQDWLARVQSQSGFVPQAA